MREMEWCGYIVDRIAIKCGMLCIWLSREYRFVAHTPVENSQIQAVIVEAFEEMLDLEHVFNLRCLYQPLPHKIMLHISTLRTSNISLDTLTGSHSLLEVFLGVPFYVNSL